MAIPNRAVLFTKSYKVLKKHFKPVESPPRTVLEHLLYACCLENSPYDRVDEAFARLHAHAFDWNEIRVTAITELAELMKGLPDPRRSAATLKRSLQSVFESQYSFDLEHLKKQNLGKTEKDLLKLDGTNPFVVNYLTQHALGGHAIPIDEGALECLFIIGAIDEKEKEKRAVPGLERAIPKKSGIEYGSLLHHLSAAFMASMFSPKVRDILLEINPDAQSRMPKRQRKKNAAEVVEEKTQKSKPKATATKQKAEPAKKKPTPAKSPKPTEKKTPAAASKKKTTTKKSPTKQLTRRKPR